MNFIIEKNGGTMSMLNFENELQKFKPILNISGIEEQIVTEDMRDVIDLIKAYAGEDGTYIAMKNDLTDKES